MIPQDSAVKSLKSCTKGIFPQVDGRAPPRRGEAREPLYLSRALALVR